MLENILCPCCSGQEFKICCAPIVSGKQIAANPLALMRSRYVAYESNNDAHILRTMRGKPLLEFKASMAKNSSLDIYDWQRLEIIAAAQVLPADKYGFVEFKAYYSCNNVDYILHERSKFSKINGCWYYVSGKLLA
jgi:SEC-C motif-containing protein